MPCSQMAWASTARDAMAMCSRELHLRTGKKRAIQESQGLEGGTMQTYSSHCSVCVNTPIAGHALILSVGETIAMHTLEVECCRHSGLKHITAAILYSRTTQAPVITAAASMAVQVLQTFPCASPQCCVKGTCSYRCFMCAPTFSQPASKPGFALGLLST